MPPSASSAIVRPPDADPVSAASTLVATASETSGPPSIDEHPVPHQRESGQRRDDRAEADEARDAEHRQDGGVGAGVHARAQRAAAGQLIAITTTMAAASAVTTAHTPPTAASEVAPQASSARKEASRRGKMNERHYEIDADDDGERQNARAIGGPPSL